MNAKNQLFYAINEEKEKFLFENAYIFFDTSALLDFYYYSENTQSEIFKKLFSPLKRRLWIAAQTEYEFLKNREKVFLKPIDSYDRLQSKNKSQQDGGHIDSIEEIIKSLINSVKKDLAGQIKTLKEKTAKNEKHPYLDDVIFDDFEAKSKLLEQYLAKYYLSFTEFKNGVDTKINAQKELLKSALIKDKVLEAFQKSFQTTPGSSYSDILKIIEEGEVRYRNEIPPGYMDDDDKVGFQKYGDLILWKQIIAKSKEAGKDVILVINDLKEDWWYSPQKGKPVSPRHELIKELFDESGKTFWMYDINDFIFKSKSLIASTIKEDVIQDVKSITQPTFYLDQTIISRWLASYFELSAATINFYDAVENEGINYTYTSLSGEKVGFSHRYIGKARYTGIYLPLRSALSYMSHAKASQNLDKMCLVIECASYDSGAQLVTYMSRKNPKNLLDLSKGLFRLLIVAREDNQIVVVYDSDDYDIV